MKRFMALSLGLIALLAGCTPAQSAESFATQGCRKFTEMIKSGYPQVSVFSVDQIVPNPKKELQKTFPYAGVWAKFSQAIAKSESNLDLQIDVINSKFASAAKRDTKYLNLSNKFAENFGSWQPIPKDWVYIVSGFDLKNSRVFDIGLANGIPWNSTIEALARATAGQIPPSAKFDVLEDIDSQCRMIDAR